MARIRTLILDKTGTLTDGRPADRLDRQPRRTWGGRHPAPCCGARSGLETPRGAGHRGGGKARGFTLAHPRRCGRNPGRRRDRPSTGGRSSRGGDGFVAGAWGASPAIIPELAAGSVMVAVAVDGRMAGHLVMSDPLREGAAEMLETLRAQGHRAHPAWPPATGPRWRAGDGGAWPRRHPPGCRPDEKVCWSAEHKNGPRDDGGRRRQRRAGAGGCRCGRRDGRARGRCGSAEAADVVLLVDRVDRIAPGIEIARGRAASRSKAWSRGSACRFWA
jgi:hypothetical protein